MIDIVPLLKKAKAHPPPYELAEILDTIVRLGIKQKTVAADLDLSPPWVSRMIKAHRAAVEHPALARAWRDGMPTDIVFHASRYPDRMTEIIETWKPTPGAASPTDPLIFAAELFLNARKKLPRYSLGVYHGLLLARGGAVDLDLEWARVERVAKRLKRRTA